MRSLSTVLMSVIILALVIVVVGCSSFHTSMGVGYRKLPEKVASPLFPYLESAQGIGLTPAQIELILKFLSGDSFKYLFPNDSRCELGLWVEISAETD